MFFKVASLRWFWVATLDWLKSSFWDKCVLVCKHALYHIYLKLFEPMLKQPTLGFKISSELYCGDQKNNPVKPLLTATITTFTYSTRAKPRCREHSPYPSGGRCSVWFACFPCKTKPLLESQWVIKSGIKNTQSWLSIQLLPYGPGCPAYVTSDIRATPYLAIWRDRSGAT